MDRAVRLMDVARLGGREGILIHKPANVYYLSGFSGEGVLLLWAQRRAVITDFRYTEQALAQAPGWDVLETVSGQSYSALAAQTAQDAGLQRLRYEDDCVTVRTLGQIQAILTQAECVPLGALPEGMRAIKDAGELALIQQACAISSQAFGVICAFIRPGQTEKEIGLELDRQLALLGGDKPAFSSIVASGPNGSLPHAVPGARAIAAGDMITLDYGAKVGGYCADMTRTVAVGQPGRQMAEIYELVRSAQAKAQEALAAGRACRQVDALARDLISQAGYGSAFGHGLGHSLGIDIHEDPRLSPVSQDTLAAGHVVTVEPGIYLAGIGGVRIENTCVITQDGYRCLVDAPRELLML